MENADFVHQFQGWMRCFQLFFSTRLSIKFTHIFIWYIFQFFLFFLFSGNFAYFMLRLKQQSFIFVCFVRVGELLFPLRQSIRGYNKMSAQALNKFIL